MDVNSERVGDALIVRIGDERIDAAVAIHFKDAMREAARTPSRRVVLDLSGVGFLDSSGLGAVVGVMKELGPGRPLELAGLTPTVDRVFRLTRMDSVFTIHADASAAVAATAGQDVRRDAG
ncbi:anti-sigma factor antagonist [Aliigemmobacter aestuarii]|uniref:Anti-sigma factor antagonist n=1 Tax=Aliigemmobacter aestuarii TaxID=1445661 RepID=A0A4S3MP10_9RHOB|nr:STAS domain-containing protein [Gemmobacter aestuarii]THD83683.1 anti-sigma factor antagonist [Gemmobacter aestuarii]